MFSTFFHRYSRYSFARNERKNTSKKPSRYNFSIKSALLYFGKTTRSPLPEKPDKTGFSVRRTPKGSPEGTEHEVRCQPLGRTANAVRLKSSTQRLEIFGASRMLGEACEKNLRRNTTSISSEFYP